MIREHSFLPTESLYTPEFIKSLITFESGCEMKDTWKGYLPGFEIKNKEGKTIAFSETYWIPDGTPVEMFSLDSFNKFLKEIKLLF